MADETPIPLNHLVRELVRLQDQVKVLQQTVEDLLPAAEGEAVAVRAGGDRERLTAG